MRCSPFRTPDLPLSRLGLAALLAALLLAPAGLAVAPPASPETKASDTPAAELGFMGAAVGSALLTLDKKLRHIARRAQPSP